MREAAVSHPVKELIYTYTLHMRSQNLMQPVCDDQKIFVCNIDFKEKISTFSRIFVYMFNLEKQRLYNITTLSVEDGLDKTPKKTMSRSGGRLSYWLLFIL